MTKIEIKNEKKGEKEIRLTKIEIIKKKKKRLGMEFSGVIFSSKATL